MKDAIEVTVMWAPGWAAYWQKTINFTMAATTMKSRADSFKMLRHVLGSSDIALFLPKKIKVKEIKKVLLKITSNNSVEHN